MNYKIVDKPSYYYMTFLFFNFLFFYTYFSSDVIRSNFALKNSDELMSHIDYTAIHLLSYEQPK